MHFPTLAQSLVRRFRRPLTWGLILGFGLAWVAARRLAGVPFDRMGPWEFVVPSLFLAGHLALAAIPWQWTGDGRSAASLWRGLAQAVPWNLAWVLLFLGLVHEQVRPAKPPAPPAEQSLQVVDEKQPPGPPPRDEFRPTPPRRDEAERRPRETEPERRPPQTGVRPELMLLFLNLPFALVLGYFLSEKERAELAGEELRERERQARARALQSQLHPHVLFNVLSGLTELVHEDADAAEEALVGLTELLRMLMRHGAALSLPLGQERALLKRYLAIEAIRLEGRLQVQWTWQEVLDAIPLPPLLLQPLVENAIRHGIAPTPEGGQLRIEALRTGTGLLLRVSNTGRPLPPEVKDGTGLGNLRERLALLPALKPTLDVRREGDWTVAELRLEGTLRA